jgi:hypothetical protein
MRDSDPPEGFRQTEYLLETLAAFRQCVEWSRLGYRERRFAELKLTFVGSDRMPALDPDLTFAAHISSPRSGRSCAIVIRRTDSVNRNACRDPGRVLSVQKVEKTGVP